MHRPLIEPALKQLDDEPAVYFYDFVRQLEADPRTKSNSNLVYLVLRDAIPLLPTILDAKILIDELFSFIDANRVAIEQRIHGPRFAVDSGPLRPLVLKYIKQISDRCWERVEAGEITPDGADIWRMNWPYGEDEEEFPYKGDEDEATSDIDQLNARLEDYKSSGNKK